MRHANEGDMFLNTIITWLFMDF